MKFIIILYIVKKKFQNALDFPLLILIFYQILIRFAIIIPILIKSNHNLIKNWEENLKIKCILNFFGIFYILQVATTQKLQHFTVNGCVVIYGVTAVLRYKRIRGPKCTFHDFF